MEKSDSEATSGAAAVTAATEEENDAIISSMGEKALEKLMAEQSDEESNPCEKSDPSTTDAAATTLESVDAEKESVNVSFASRSVENIKSQLNISNVATSIPPLSSQSSSLKDEIPSSQQQQSAASHLSRFTPDMFVWAKQTKRGIHWPARVAHLSEKTSKRPSDNHVWLYMYDSDSFMWVQEDMIDEYTECDDVVDEKVSAGNKSKSFNAALDKLKEERLAELSGTSPIHCKIKTVPLPSSTPHTPLSTSKKRINEASSSAVTNTQLSSHKTTSSSRLKKGQSTAAAAIMGNSDIYSESMNASVSSEDSQPSMYQDNGGGDDFVLTPDRVLDMLDKQLDMVSSSKYYNTNTCSSSSYHSPSSSHHFHPKGNSNQHSSSSVGSARKRTSAHKGDDQPPRSKKCAPITCSDFSNDGLQESSLENHPLDGNESESERRSHNSNFNIDQSPTKSPFKGDGDTCGSSTAAPHNSSRVNPSSSSSAFSPRSLSASTSNFEAAGSGGNKRQPASSCATSGGGVAQIKPIRRPQPFDKTVGLIGVGQIGYNLAELLLKHSFNVYLWNKTPQKCSELRKLGAKICISAGDVMSRSDVTFCCVNDSEAVREVLVGTNGALNEMKRGKSFVNMSTCEPKASTEFYQLVQMRGAKYLETPLIGSKKDSQQGTFLILAAGDYSLYEEILPCLELFSKKRSYVGAAGKACEMQVLMNMLYGNQIAVLAEAMALCRKSGVDRQQLLSVLASSDLASPFLVQKAEMIVGGNECFEPAEKKLCHQQSDLKLALGLSDQLMQAMPITASCNELFKRALSWGDEDLDVAVVYKAACL